MCTRLSVSIYCAGCHQAGSAGSHWSYRQGAGHDLWFRCMVILMMMYWCVDRCLPAWAISELLWCCADCWLPFHYCREVDWCWCWLVATVMVCCVLSRKPRNSFGRCCQMLYRIAVWRLSFDFHLMASSVAYYSIELVVWLTRRSISWDGPGEAESRTIQAGFSTSTRMSSERSERRSRLSKRIKKRTWKENA